MRIARGRRGAIGRVAGSLFAVGALASIPIDRLLTNPRPPSWIELLTALGLCSGIVCFLIPWDGLSRRWLHAIPIVATLELALLAVIAGVVAFLREGLEARQRELEELSLRDPLTGVGNTAENPAADEAVLSGSGSSIPVDTSGATGDATPPVGEAVDATVEVETDGTIKVDEVTDAGQSGAFRVEGKVLAIDDQARTLTISADDDGASGQSLTVTLPASFDLSAYAVGDCVELTVSQAADGSLTAIQSFADDNQGDANDNGSDGRDRGGPGGDHSDHHQDGDQGDSNDASGSGDGQSTSSSGSDGGGG